jgi:hypothetical protein
MIPKHPGHLFRLRHLIAHLLGWNLGKIEDWSEGGRHYIGFRCIGCGELRNAFEIT